jgi:transitional endoplasmic reticulum ATPase
VPLTRGVLLYGPYGTGKTMTAYVSALKAVRSGWTFIYLESVQDLKKGLEFAAKYAPCVLFAEDIDRVITGERSLSMDDVLNTLDGIDTKGAEIITVFTTNHIEVINPAMLRMGRLDTLVEVLPPDAKAAERLVKLYSRGLLSKEANLSRIGKTLEGQIPAFIREVTERAKIAAIARIGNDSIEGKVLEEDLISAAKAMETHANMLKPREEPVNNDAELFVRVPANHQRGKLLLASLNGEAKKKTA